MKADGRGEDELKKGGEVKTDLNEILNTPTSPATLLSFVLHKEPANTFHSNEEPRSSTLSLSNESESSARAFLDERTSATISSSVKREMSSGTLGALVFYDGSSSSNNSDSEDVG